MKGLFNKNFIEENKLAIKFWKKKSEQEQIKDYSSRNISIEEIKLAYSQWFNKLWQDNSLNAVANSKNKNFKLRVKIKDKNCILEMSLFRIKFLLKKTGIYDCEISSETLLFLLKNNFGRGTVTVNGRIQFNYDFAHRFFILFFISYANNIGRFFIKNNLSSSMLKSIGNTSVMISILKFNKKSKINFTRDLRLFD